MNLSETLRSVFPWVDEQDLVTAVALLEDKYTTVCLPFPAAAYQELAGLLSRRRSSVPLLQPEMHLTALKIPDGWLWFVASSFDLPGESDSVYLPLAQAKMAWQLRQHERTSRREQEVLQDIIDGRAALSLLSNYKGVK